MRVSAGDTDQPQFPRMGSASGLMSSAMMNRMFFGSLALTKLNREADNSKSNTILVKCSHFQQYYFNQNDTKVSTLIEDEDACTTSRFQLSQTCLAIEIACVLCLEGLFAYTNTFCHSLWSCLLCQYIWCKNKNELLITRSIS